MYTYTTGDGKRLDTDMSTTGSDKHRDKDIDSQRLP